MPPLDSAARRALRARAHHLHPVVAVGQQGLTPAVLKEIDVALRAHELIKVRVFGDDRAAREALLDAICTTLEAAPVQHLGKLLVVFRPRPEGPKVAAARKPGGRATRKPGHGAKPAPKTRKPRDGAKPAPRTGKTRDDAKPGPRARKAWEEAAKPGPRARQPATKGRPSAPRTPADGPPPRGGRPPRTDDAALPGGGSSRRRRGQGADARKAPPAGVPRAALPRRRRPRG